MKKEDIIKSGIVTNKQFSETNQFFQKCCEAVNLQPTSRQASKFRNKQGRAYKEGIIILRRKTQNDSSKNGNNAKRK